LLQEAVGGEEKAYGLMEAHLNTLEAGEGDADIEEGTINEDSTDDKETEDVDTVERLLSEDGPDDAKMARYKELSEEALERLGVGVLAS
jgi:hypothetical protein